MSQTNAPTHTKSKKRQRFDWTTKTDPDSGDVTRFCSKCQDFLPLDRFYHCHVKNHTLCCKTHWQARALPNAIECNRRKRGKPGSVARVRSNLNKWILAQKRGWPKWSDDDVKRALVKHSVDLASETRIVRLRPSDRSQPFNVANSVAKFQNGSCLKPNSQLSLRGARFSVSITKKRVSYRPLQLKTIGKKMKT